MNNTKTKIKNWIKSKINNTARFIFMGGVMKKSNDYSTLRDREKFMIIGIYKSFAKSLMLFIFLTALSIIWLIPNREAGELLFSDISQSKKQETILTPTAFEAVKPAQASTQPQKDTFKLLDEFPATVYAYNSFESQTDGDPCTGAFGYICDKTHVVANNCYLPGTIVEILGEKYEVYDRMNARYSCDVFDVYMGMDHQAALDWGKKQVNVKILRVNK